MEDALSGRAAAHLDRRPVRSEAGWSRSRLLGICRAALPVLTVAVVLAGLITARLAVFGGDVTGLVEFGHKFAHQTHPPAGAFAGSRSGYDGQFFYLQAKDPLLLHDSTIDSMRAAGAGFRLQRMGYPLLAFVVAGGSTAALPIALLAVNVVALLALAAFFAVYARRRGWPTQWAAAMALTPGLLLPMLRDLSDPLATTCLLAGVLLAQSRRRWSAATALTLAVLTREVAILVVLALGLELGVRAWRARGKPGGWRAVIQRAWPVVVVPIAAFCAWQAYVTVRYGGLLGTSDTGGIPGLNLVQEIRTSIATAPTFAFAAWDTMYVVLMIAGIVAAAASLRRGISIPGVAACGVAIGILLPTFGDPWSDTRVSAPLFALLLVEGLQRRSRWTLLLCAAVTSMTLLIPSSLPGVLSGL